MNLWILGAAASVVVLILSAFLLNNWRRIFLPFVLLYSAVKWVKVVLSIPDALRDYLVSASWMHYAQIAAALHDSNSAFRPAAREIYGRVVAGCGIRPEAGSFELPKEDSYSAGQVAAAASIAAGGRSKPWKCPNCSYADNKPAAGECYKCGWDRKLANTVAPVTDISEKARQQ